MKKYYIQKCNIEIFIAKAHNLRDFINNAEYYEKYRESMDADELTEEREQLQELAEGAADEINAAINECYFDVEGEEIPAGADFSELIADNTSTPHHYTSAHGLGFFEIAIAQIYEIDEESDTIDIVAQSKYKTADLLSLYDID